MKQNMGFRILRHSTVCVRSKAGACHNFEVGRSARPAPHTLLQIGVVLQHTEGSGKEFLDTVFTIYVIYVTYLQ